MLIQAKLSTHFRIPALFYACEILDILPGRNVLNEHNEPTTPYYLRKKKKPLFGKYKVFGCPAVVHKPEQSLDGTIINKKLQIQRGLRTTFIGIPTNQAGYLFYSEEPIRGSHLLISLDAVFNEEFVTATASTSKVFSAGQTVRTVGNGYVPPPYPLEQETTGDISDFLDITEETSSPEEIKQKDSPENPTNLATPLSDSEQVYKQTPLDDTPVPPQVGISEDLSESTAFIHTLEDILHQETHKENEFIAILDELSQQKDFSLAQYLPEPKGYKALMRLPDKIREDWLKAIRAEFSNLVNNQTFDLDTKPYQGEEIIPTMIILKAKMNSDGSLDKLKGRCVARGDLQENTTAEEMWSGCVSTRTVRLFLAYAAKLLKRVRQLDFVGAYLQAHVKGRVFVNLPTEYKKHCPGLEKYFERPLRLKNLFTA